MVSDEQLPSATEPVTGHAYLRLARAASKQRPMCARAPYAVPAPSEPRLTMRGVWVVWRFSFFALQPPCAAMQLVLVSTDGFACQGQLRADSEAEGAVPAMRAALKVIDKHTDASMTPNESNLSDCYVYLTTLGVHHLPPR
jgi:hypothetical protein